ncbi:MAG: hypothetical protein HQ488_01755 [Parcubacteria group bacterium]|nr:hypothetical protein [Parcubacteria group bacterium]
MKRLVLTIALSLLMPGIVSAASVSPSLLEITAERGETTEESISVINTSRIDKTYYLDVIEFIARKEGGEPQFLTSGESNSEHLGWFSFKTDTVIVPAESVGEVVFDVSVPPNVPSGGYYAAVTISESPEDLLASNGTMIDAKIAVLMLITVEGETIESARLLDFMSDMSGGLLSTLDLDTQYRIQNQGNVHIFPSGTISVTDFFGRAISEIDANETLGRVLPDSTRAYKASISSGDHVGWYELINHQAQYFAIGPMTVTLDLMYGNDSLPIQAQFSFWLIPWQLGLTVILLVVLLLLVYKLGARASRRTYKS